MIFDYTEANEVLTTMKDSCFFIKYYDLSKCSDDYHLAVGLSFGMTGIICAYNIYFLGDISDRVLLFLLIFSLLIVGLELFLALHLSNQKYKPLSESTIKNLMSNELTKKYLGNHIEGLTNQSLYLIFKQLDLKLDCGLYEIEGLSQ